MRELESLQQRISNGKLHLRVRDFIELMLKNSTAVQLTRLDVYTAADQIVSARAPFDPTLSASFNALRSVTPFFFGGGTGFAGLGSGSSTGSSGTGSTGTGGTGTGGAPLILLPQTISSLTQNTSLTYTQLLPTGQTLSANFSGVRSSGDEYPFPAVFGSLNFQLAQPLLQNRTNLQARAPLTIARTGLLVTSEQSEATIGEAVATAARQYWDAVALRDGIKVQEQTLGLAEKSYDRDKLALDLGALASLDIYQSQTQVAERKRDLVEAQYRYRVALDGLRRFIGADLSPELRATEIVLDDDPSVTPAHSEVLPFEAALKKALESRPELKALDNRLSIDNLSAKVATDSLLPQLNLTLNGGSSGPSLNPVQAGSVLGIPATPYPGYGQALRQILGFDFPSYGFGVVLNFPLRNSTARAQLADAYVSRTRDRYQKRQTQQDVTLQVRQAIDNIELAGASISAAVTARDLARKNVEAEQQKYQLGTITAFELLDSQSRLASSENALLNAYVVYQEAFVDYQHATWTLLDGFGIVVEPPKGRL
ncbi:MAG: TolC family protein [Acidobacteriaceae bacterium]|nr:TolC family protein [Acidobacteriaceae bacterium]